MELANVNDKMLNQVLYSRSLPHRLGRDNRILSRHEREKWCRTHLRGSRDPAWVLTAVWSPC
jgi:hypothetical protein